MGKEFHMRALHRRIIIRITLKTHIKLIWRTFIRNTLPSTSETLKKFCTFRSFDLGDQ